MYLNISHLKLFIIDQYSFHLIIHLIDELNLLFIIS